MLLRPWAEQEPVLSPDELASIDEAAKHHELVRLLGMSVLEEVGDRLPDHRELTTKYVLTWRAKTLRGPEDTERPVWLRRARLVAREYNWIDPHREGLFAPASSSNLVRVIPSLFQHGRASNRPFGLMAFDVSDAYLTCQQPSKTCIRIGSAWYVLLRCLPGQRDGSLAWYREFSGFLQEEARVQFSVEAPALFRIPHADEPQPQAVTIPGHSITVTVADQGLTQHPPDAGGLIHVDDVLTAGEISVLEGLESKVRARYKITVQWLTCEGEELVFLKRRHFIVEGRLLIEPHQRHFGKLAELIGGLPRSPKRSPMPSTVDPSEAPLGDDKAGRFRSAVGVLLYLQPDLVAAQYAIRHLSTFMATPTEGAWKTLKHVVSYVCSTSDHVLRGHEVWLEVQEHPHR